MTRSSLLPAPWRALPAGPVVAAAVVGVAYAFHDGLPLRLAPGVLIVLAALAGQVGLSRAMSLLDPEGSPDPAGPEDMPRAVVTVLAACGAAVALGLSAALMSQPLVFLAGALGAVLAVALVLPIVPVAYLGSGIGEAALMALAGPVPTVAAYASQGGTLHAGALTASVPAALFALGIVLLSHRAFATDDDAAGRRTLAVTAGPSTARWLSWGTFAAAYVSLVLVALSGEFPRTALAGLCTLPAALWVLARGERDRSRESRLREARDMGRVVTVTLAIAACAMFLRRW